MPEISIVIPVYNPDENYIIQALESVFAQTYTDYEIIIVDDGSAKDVKDIIGQFKDKLRYIYQENKGQSSARNCGIKNASGKYIAFLDQDDIWMPQKLAVQIGHLEDSDDVALVNCSFCCINNKEESTVERVFKKGVYDKNTLSKLTLRNTIGPPSSIMIRKTMIEEVGSFDENISGAEDRDLWYRLVQRYKVKLLDDILLKYRMHESSAHKNVRYMKKAQLNFIKKHIKAMNIIELMRAVSYVYSDASAEYIVTKEKFKTLRNALAAIVIFPFKVSPDDNKYKNLIKSIMPRKIDINRKGLISWLPAYLFQKAATKHNATLHDDDTTHVILCVVDHYEPFNGGVSSKRARERVEKWVNDYPGIMKNYKDIDGRYPQHTWFYPPHLDQAFLKELLDMCKRGYGEIEMHLHHNHMEPFPDTSETLRSKIIKCIDDYSKLGIFCLPDGSKRFAFIHGDWSLDNSRGEKFCGINDEITILKECGCYADFTFPSLGKAQPAMINKIYYAKDNPDKPKSYNKGKEVEVCGKPWGDLLMVPGIIGMRWKSRTHRLKPSIESSDISGANPPFKERIDYWIRNAITIKGLPEWRFVKLHTHGAIEENWDPMFGKKAELMYDYLSEQYNDGRKYRLHYVTAREMYNIIRAAEAEKKGGPGEYRDFIIPKYTYLTGNQ